MFLAPAPAAPDADQLLQADVADGGYVMNLTRAWAWRADLATGFATVRRQLMLRSRLDRRDWVIAACACASTAGDSYCSLSFGNVLAALIDAPTAAALLRGEAPATLTPRELAIVTWARKVARDPNATTAEDAGALRAVGLRDKEIFELTAFVAFRLAFAAVNDALGVPPDAELARAASPDVLAAVNFGRAPALAPAAT